MQQSFPSKPIRVVIPFVAGGSSDIVGRAIGSKFQEFLGQPAVVENKPGANGAIAAEFVAKSDPDGHTILVGSIGVFSINAALFKDLRYNPLRDFAPITLAVTTPNVLITKPALAADSMKELVDYAKKNPGQALLLLERHGILGPPDRGAPQARWRASLRCTCPTRAAPRARPTSWAGRSTSRSRTSARSRTTSRGNRMKALAVTAKARNPQLPNVPTTAEGGFPDLVVTSWQAAAAPAKTPREIVARLNEAAVKALRSPEVRERMSQIGFDVVGSTPEEFGRFMKEEVDRWTEVVKRGGIKPE